MINKFIKTNYFNIISKIVFYFIINNKTFFIQFLNFL